MAINSDLRGGALPEPLFIEEIDDRAAALAASLNGLRCSDAVEVIEKAREYLLRSSRAETARIPQDSERRVNFGRPSNDALLRRQSAPPSAAGQ
jgi:hypothetical protein